MGRLMEEIPMSDPLADATTRNSSIDAEHRIQVGLIDALCAAVHAEQPKQAVAEILRQLIAYSEAHFLSEELLMRLASYDDFDEHVADHAHMLTSLKEIAIRHEVGATELVIGKAHAVLDFLRCHIQTRDLQFQNWYRA
jgi:hemerythrin